MEVSECCSWSLTTQANPLYQIWGGGDYRQKKTHAMLPRTLNFVSLSSPPVGRCNLDKTATKFHFTSIEEESVPHLLSELNTKEATGHDMISAKLPKTTVPAIARSLTYQFNMNLKTGKFPLDWKLAMVTPIPKSGDRQSILNY